MLEQQRIEYLQAMGIQLWMPRQALDHAAESNWLADSVDGGTQPETAGNGAAIKAGNAAELLAGMGFGESAKESNKLEPQTKPVDIEETQSRVQIKSDLQQPITSEMPAELVLIEGTAEEPLTDLTAPKFELYFALWPCGILWVSSQVFEQQDHGYQTAVSYSLLGNAVPQANYSQFKWPYIEGSHEDQSMAVALRALSAQWDFMSSQGARGWVATDSSSLEWLGKVAGKVLYSVDERSELFSTMGKKQLWRALQTLPNNTVS